MKRSTQITGPDIVATGLPTRQPDEPGITTLPKLIDLIGSGSFFEDLAECLETTFGFADFHIFLYQTDAAPINLANRPRECAHRLGLDNFLNFTYVINPVFRAFRNGAASGVYLISDFVPDDFKRVIEAAQLDIHVEASESIGYRTPGWPRNMAECIGLIQLPDGTALDLSFLIPSGAAQTAACRARLARIFPVLERVVQKQFELAPGSFDFETRGPGQEDQFQNFGRDVLTDREMQVVQLILVGHSSTSVALKLDVSLSTVKSHRRNIYAKLRISSQAELFSLFLLHLK